MVSPASHYYYSHLDKVVNPSGDRYLPRVSLPVSHDLQVTVGTSFFAALTISASSGAQLGLLGATAELRVSVSPADPQPLVDVTTTPGADGGLLLGVTFPPLGGVAVSNGSGLVQLGGLPLVTTSLPTPALFVADVPTLEAAATAAYVLGTVAFVESGAGAYYNWSPNDPSTPNGTTIVAGLGGSGNWLQAGTVNISFTPAATAALVGYDIASWVLLVTFADGEVVPLVGGMVVVLPEEPVAA